MKTFSLQNIYFPKNKPQIFSKSSKKNQSQQFNNGQFNNCILFYFCQFFNIYNDAKSRHSGENYYSVIFKKNSKAKLFPSLLLSFIHKCY